jgi:UDP-N-acetylglucosamine acyltransferase
MASIHPTAVVDSQAEIASDVSIGPFCVIEAGVTIEKGCQIASHAVVKTGTSMGENNVVSEGAVLGGRPQHLQAGERVGMLRVGSNNSIRENVTIHSAVKEGDWTIVGDANLIMVNAHIGHDCRIGSNTIIANNAMISGHVVVEDRVYISGAAGIHQFCRIGQLAMVGGQSHIRRDVPPYVMLDGQSSHVVGLNVIGLRRAGFNDEDIVQLKEAYRYIYRSGLSWADILKGLPTEFPDGPAAVYHDFLRRGKRGIMQDRRGPVRSTIRIFPSDDEAAEQKENVRTAS